MDELEFNVASQRPRERGAVLDFAESLNEGLLNLLRGHSVSGKSADDFSKSGDRSLRLRRGLMQRMHSA